MTPEERERALGGLEGAARKIANTFRDKYPHLDPAEIAQSVWIGFVAVANRFEPRDTAKFFTPAYTAGRNAAFDFVVREKNRGLTPIPWRRPSDAPELASLNAEAPGQDGKPTELGQTLPDPRSVPPEANLDAEDWWRTVFAGMPRHYREVAELRFRESLSLNEIGERFGRDKRWAHSVLNGAIVRLRLRYIRGELREWFGSDRVVPMRHWDRTRAGNPRRIETETANGTTS